MSEAGLVEKSGTKINQATLRALRDVIAERQSAMLELVRAIVECESPSGDLRGSREVVSLLVDEIQKLSVVTKIERQVAPNDYGENLRVTFFGDGAHDEQKTILLIGHTDTVYARGTLRERGWREVDGRIYAPGIFDMKANCVLAIEALRACAKLNLKASHPVVLLLTCDEETGSMSGRALVEAEAERAAHVLVLEPSAPNGRAKTGRKGTGVFELHAHGIAAHAGLDPEKGASAIHELTRQSERLLSLADSSKGTTINIGVIEGGTRANVVAESARVEIDVRFTTKTEARRIEQSFRELKSFDSRVKLEWTGGINRPPLETTPEVCALYSRARNLAAMLDFDLGQTQVGGASDGNFAAAFCPSVLDGLGIEGDGAHAAHEHIIKDSISTRGALLAGLIASL
ncbi:MAG: M20 family metallopeptidase [Pyrinomonadaceae bacterium]